MKSPAKMLRKLKKIIHPQFYKINETLFIKSNKNIISRTRFRPDLFVRSICSKDQTKENRQTQNSNGKNAAETDRQIAESYAD